MQFRETLQEDNLTAEDNMESSSVLEALEIALMTYYNRQNGS